ncbi:HAD-IB family hydrolase [Paenibacillus thiaminolyticus]|uniref:HAD-IB family hydrolase n=1 Tax=Paenibacillus thiaminolyticus TaxID=49283 RepID=A0AAP9DRY4_PANTH|nr:HAD-IB family hydrolase [Paenibacillus thiaminolyticus]MCY9536387.1 HAD-IB family hydrolase [Paenibacillus thiaminolyticus]MCY9601399.1 HAD-IB family hydrolase [Paenibacillus thiaminolyticus]MCY9609279.1 HAD-IB family hydrolase [Paenibacillus thiaminolyticus]MCY9613054.1 HAD-IB family hydrolase [Paenibacillus thiaminolyticus]MCY9616962.1 HAD-IB family hydrolase [Paenibacillus thiaminolyticus]
MLSKVALFDIDKTIIRRDSMFLFLKYGLAAKPRSAIHLPALAWNLLLYKLGIMPAEKAKQFFFRSIAYMDEGDLEAFYDRVLVPEMYQDALAEMRSRKKLGYRVLLVTASPVAYMKYFKKLGCVDEVLGTELQRRNGCYTHLIEGKNCKAEEKVARIRDYLERHQLEIDYEASCAYSDCTSDLPMLEMAGQRYLIRNAPIKQEGLEVIRWSS